MPRQPRLLVPDGIYHVAAHASHMRSLFQTDRDRELFLERLGVVVVRHELTLVAYCLMGNHYHLVTRTPDARLSTALKELNGGYSQHFNRRHEHAAHLIRAHPLVQLVEDQLYLLAACRYLAWNPVDAGLCTQPSEWAWSSFGATIGTAPAPEFLDERLLEGACGGGARWRERYRRFVEPRPEDVAPGVVERM